MSVIDDVPEDVELQEQRQEFLVTKIIVDEADEEIDLEDDEFIEIDEPKVYQSDPCLREDAGGGDEDDGPGGEKKEADAEERRRRVFVVRPTGPRRSRMTPVRQVCRWRER